MTPAIVRAAVLAAFVLTGGCASIRHPPDPAPGAGSSTPEPTSITPPSGSETAAPNGSNGAPSDRSIRQQLEDAGVEFAFDGGVVTQGIDAADSGKEWLSTYMWQSYGSWRAFEDRGIGTGSLVWFLLGANGINYDADDENPSINAGSISTLSLTDVVQDPIAVNDLYWRQQFSGREWTLSFGKMDLSNQFDTNRVANNYLHEFTANAFVNSLAIPFATLGGFGAVLRWDHSETGYVMIGMGDSSVTDATAPWKTSDNDSWYELFEWGTTAEIDGLGKGTYRLIPWHNKLYDESGWGFGLSFDQELGSEDLIGFLRLGTADDDVAAVERFASIGAEITAPLGRRGETLGLGLARSNPSDDTLRTEALIEGYYEFDLSSGMKVAPGVQYIHQPGASDDDRVWLFTFRATISF